MLVQLNSVHKEESSVSVCLVPAFARRIEVVSVGSEDEGRRREIPIPQNRDTSPAGHRGGTQGTRRLNYNQRVIDGILSGEAESLRFVSDFWAFTPSEQDKEWFSRFCKFVRYDEVTKSLDEVVAIIGIHRDTVRHWRDGTRLPFLAKIYLSHITLGKPREGCKWIPLRIARNGSSFEHLIQVPSAVNSERDIKQVLRQLRGASIRKFGFLLGVMLGDAGKGMNLYIKGVHRIPSFNIHMNLTQKYKHNERFAEYTAACCASIRLSMYRIKDKPSSEKQLKSLTRSRNYAWRSERSPFLAWMHVACLGLGIHETTTKAPVRMEWSLGASETFRISFLQGVSESDGSASYSGYARIESWPNALFIANLIQSLGTTCTLTKKGDRLAGVAMTIDRAASIHLFN